MATAGKVKFYTDHVLARVHNVTDEFLQACAFQIEAETKVNIQRNSQLDTGFMLNSTYTVTRKANTFANTDASGMYANRKGENVKRASVPPSPLPDKARAGVAVGAEYAIYQEEKKPFLFPAAEKVAREQGGDAKRVFKDL